MTEYKKKEIHEQLMKCNKENLVAMYIEASMNFRNALIETVIKKNYDSVDDLKKDLAKFIEMSQEEK